MESSRTYWVGIDIGGTFTDIVFLASDGSLETRKVPSTPDDYGRGIVVGMESILRDLNAPPSAVQSVTHATTVATNAILEHKGARAGLITTQGFRDVLGLRRTRIAEMYNPDYEKPVALLPRRLCLEVIERIGPRGEVRVPLDESSVITAASRLRDEGVEAVAICLINAYINPLHEKAVAALVRQAMPAGTYVTCSHAILPEIREYERTSTAVVNALLGPVVGRYIEALTGKLQKMGIRRPLQIMQSSGGLMSARAVSEKPVSILESGPAAGVIAAARVARKIGASNLITLDMGGTTAKAAIIEDGEPAKTTEYEVGTGINLSSRLASGGGYPIKLPVIDVSEIGAGGGSKVWLDKAGHMHVGPQSAGSVPGPVCYATGGETVTLTDALLVLGYLNPDYLAGGAVRLDSARARTALEEQVARPLGKSLLEAAHGIFTIAGSNMVRAVKAVTTYRGRDPRDFTLCAFGGNGPLMALEIARVLGIRRVLIPPMPGVFSALGLLLSDAEYDAQKSILGNVADFDAREIDREYRQLEDTVVAQLEVDGHAREKIVTTRSADLRYVGQSFELSVRVGHGQLNQPTPGSLIDSFHDEHERTYGHKRVGHPVELVNIRVRARAAMPIPGQFDPGRTLRLHGESAPAQARREAYFGPRTGTIDTPVLVRKDLGGAPVDGPAIIEEYDATCVIPPGCRASLDSLANIEIHVLIGRGIHR